MKKTLVIMIGIVALFMCGCSTPLTNCHVTNRVYVGPHDEMRVSYIRGWPCYETVHWSYQRYFVITGTNPDGALENDTVHVSQEVWDNATPGMPWPNL